MNIVFFGSSSFAVPSLAALKEAGHNIPCVVTQPDRKKGRGMRPGETPVACAAKALAIKIHQPLKINTAQEAESLKKFNAQLFVVVAYGQILSQPILDVPEIFCLNAHASLLPKYRGAAPINRAVINGEKETGVSVMRMEQKMDAGPVILQERIAVGADDSVCELEERLSLLAGKLLVNSVALIAQGKYSLLPQEESGVSLAPKLKKEDGLIDWNRDAQEVYNLIRGCCGWPGAFTRYKGRLLKIYKALPRCPSAPIGKAGPGRVWEVLKGSIVVACGSGCLAIEQLQLEGKKIMSARDFIAGSRIKPGEILGK